MCSLLNAMRRSLLSTQHIYRVIYTRVGWIEKRAEERVIERCGGGG